MLITFYLPLITSLTDVSYSAVKFDDLFTNVLPCIFG